MICIFCGQDKKPSVEHIIPKNIGGRVVVKTVCVDCNSKFGSKVDAELNIGL